MSPDQNSIIAIVGPTGIGKTKLSISIAKAVGGEVVSVDSLQVYRQGRIMTAQATLEERQGVPHHMMDYLDADEEPTEYNEQALDCISDICSRGKVAVLCGGSTSLTEPLLFHPQIKKHHPLVLVLYSKLATMGHLTDQRIDMMLEEGLLDEVQELRALQRELPLEPDVTMGVFKSIGYSELAPCLEQRNHVLAEQSFRKGVQRMKSSTRAYAEKQSIWIFNSLLPQVLREQMDCHFFCLRGRSTFKADVEHKAVSLCQEWLHS
ncbi:hypothetical protein FH972_022600 [Carpinus fangiana]|uniref:Uncharacterized protein n=1 Tax=Carpinus fangiana TaxID=176857 RepID=A0A5N6KTD7_9ROSI|nr:hypothetical protein FH972_022600 [Carpinus fangiana]